MSRARTRVPARTLTRTRARTHTHTHARAHAHTHTHARTHSLTHTHMLSAPQAIHLSGFRYMLDETAAALARLAAERDAEARLAREAVRSVSVGRRPTARALLDRIGEQCRGVYERHAELGDARYADDAAFSALLGEMEVGRAARAARLSLSLSLSLFPLSLRGRGREGGEYCWARWRSVAPCRLASWHAL